MAEIEICFDEWLRFIESTAQIFSGQIEGWVSKKYAWY
jgi:hypothetical protein